MLDERPLDLRHELGTRATGRVVVVAIRLELGKIDRDDRLPATQVLVELDRVRRLRQVVEQERDAGDVELREERGHVVVRTLTGKHDVLEALQA